MAVATAAAPVKAVEAGAVVTVLLETMLPVLRAGLEEVVTALELLEEATDVVVETTTAEVEVEVATVVATEVELAGAALEEPAAGRLRLTPAWAHSCWATEMVVWISAGEQTELTVLVRPVMKPELLQAQAMSVAAHPV